MSWGRNDRFSPLGNSITRRRGFRDWVPGTLLPSAQDIFFGGTYLHTARRGPTYCWSTFWSWTFWPLPTSHYQLHRHYLKPSVSSPITLYELSMVHGWVEIFSIRLKFCFFWNRATERMSGSVDVFGVKFDFQPFECPICFDRYGKKNPPATLPCGHSICIKDSHLLSDGNCPICRTPCNRTTNLRPSYSLRDGADSFWSLMEELGYVEKIEERRSGVGTVNTLSRSTSLDSEEAPYITAPVHQELQEHGLNRLNRLRASPVSRSCGHQCTMTSLELCCYCIDRRPFLLDDSSYPNYVDGQGWTNSATRWEYYCPLCRCLPSEERQERLDVAASARRND